MVSSLEDLQAATDEALEAAGVPERPRAKVAWWQAERRKEEERKQVLSLFQRQASAESIKDHNSSGGGAGGLFNGGEEVKSRQGATQRRFLACREYTSFLLQPLRPIPI